MVEVPLPDFCHGVCSSSGLYSYSFHSFWSSNKRAHTLQPSEMQKICHTLFSNHFLKRLRKTHLKGKVKKYLSLKKRGNQAKVLWVLNEP